MKRLLLLIIIAGVGLSACAPECPCKVNAVKIEVSSDKPLYRVTITDNKTSNQQDILTYTKYSIGDTIL